MAQEPITRAIDNQEWLDPLAEGLQKGVAAAYEAGGKPARAVKDFLHGKWLGHPLHPVLTDVPLGAWTVAVTLDCMEAAGERGLSRGADAAVGIGLLGAAAAAVTGLTDWHILNEKTPRRVGLVHGLLNSGATALFAASWFLRKRRARAAARTLGWIGYGITCAAAYLGGKLVYTYKIGVDHAPSPSDAPKDFVAVLDDAELPEGGLRRVDASGVPVLLARREGKVYALAEACSHLRGPLSEGKMEGDSVRCPWHGSRFALEDGRVIEGPATHDQPCFEVRVRDGRIEVRLSRALAETA